MSKANSNKQKRIERRWASQTQSYFLDRKTDERYFDDDPVAIYELICILAEDIDKTNHEKQKIINAYEEVLEANKTLSERAEMNEDANATIRSLQKELHRLNTDFRYGPEFIRCPLCGSDLIHAEDDEYRFINEVYSRFKCLNSSCNYVGRIYKGKLKAVK